MNQRPGVSQALRVTISISERAPTCKNLELRSKSNWRTAALDISHLHDSLMSIAPVSRRKARA
jgi:hypothetical protein